MEIKDSYYSGTTSAADTTYNIRVPEIYSVEVTNACNFTCDFCPREEPQFKRPDTFLDPALAETIAARDLGGSRFVEFQMAGEPMLHPEIMAVIRPFTLVENILTGMSINGSAVRKTNVAAALSVDYLTVSIDSVSRYEEIRKGGKWKWIEGALRLMATRLHSIGHHRRPDIALQLIEFPGWKEEELRLVAWLVEQSIEDLFFIRTVPDCFLSTTRDKVAVPFGKQQELCLNPWMSVSVQADGDVVPCCYAWGKEVVYGNLKEQSLEEIWATSKEVKNFQRMHKEGKSEYYDICRACYARSPTLFHLDLYTDVMNRKLRRAMG